MKIKVSKDVCIGAGQCVATAPEVFDQGDDDGLVVLLTDSPSPESYDRVRDAAHVCPAQAIELSD
jgi:ferredoxin